MLTPDEMLYLLMENFKIKNKLRSINVLLDKNGILGEINYKPSYQREFLWNKIKKSYFVESLFLNMDVPPLTLIEEDYGIELVDGRQRYQTILEFVNNKFCLDIKGLPVLKHLHGKYFKDLDEKIQNAFLNDIYLRTQEIEIAPNKKLSKKEKDFIKKFLFRRYNAGLTSLSNVELEKAKYINNDIMIYFRKCLKGNVSLIQKLLELFKPNYSKKNFDESDNIERILQAFRLLFVLEDIPINLFFKRENKNGIIDSYFFVKQNKHKNRKLIYSAFIKRINLLYRFKKILDANNIRHSMLLFNALYWGISICHKEGIAYEQLDSDAFFLELKIFAQKYTDSFTNPDKNIYYPVLLRDLYKLTANFFEGYFGLKLKEYVEYQNNQNPLLDSILNLGSEKNLSYKFDFREVKKHNPDFLPINEIFNKFDQNKINLRPAYQREEKINLTKSSRIIESVLLDYAITPIYIFVGEDGIWEVIDGQQRLLTLIGFCGKSYTDENGELRKSKKHKFALQNLEVLKKYNGYTFEDLNEKEQKKILNFAIPIIFIYQKDNKYFEPVSLFLRHNSKPYPISPHSFEMWNTIMPEDIADFIKKICSQNSDWFYIVMKKNNLRKKNEQLYTTIMYLEAKTTVETHKDTPYIRFRKKLDSMQANIHKPSEISDYLYGLYSLSEKEKMCIRKKTEVFINKVKLLLSDESEQTDKNFKSALEKLILLNEGKTRNKQTMLVLWYLVSPLSEDVIKNNKEQIRNSIKNILRLFIFKKEKQIRKTDIKQKFQDAIDTYWKNFIKVVINKSEYIKNAPEKIVSVIKNEKIKRQPKPSPVHKKQIKKIDDKKQTLKENAPQKVAININLFNQDTKIDFEN